MVKVSAVLFAWADAEMGLTELISGNVTVANNHVIRILIEEV